MKGSFAIVQGKGLYKQRVPSCELDCEYWKTLLNLIMEIYCLPKYTVNG